jgi:xanthine dehydrogenase accessory factor
MLITTGGNIFGTIGGGLLEAKAMAEAEEILHGSSCRILSFDLANQDAAGMGMVCGGRVEVLLDLVLPTAENIAVFNNWQEELVKGQEGLFVTTVRQAMGKIRSIEHSLIRADGSICGQWSQSDKARQQLIDICRQARFMQVMEIEGVLTVVEPGISPPTLYILWAGHVAQPTACLAATVGFRVEVWDDRKEFANAARFPGAAVRVVTDFDSALHDLQKVSGAYGCHSRSFA